ncbi:MAG TPA: hypothetical protein VIJ00_05605 [Nakamurella sp.]
MPTSAGWLSLAGVLVFVLVAGIGLARFRRVSAVGLGGFASRAVGGTATAASRSYVLSLGAAGWAAFDRAWWLVALCAAAGGWPTRAAVAGGCGPTGPSRRHTVGGNRRRCWPWLAILAVAGLLLVGR